MVWGVYWREVLLVRAFIKESVHISNYYFLVGAFITRTFTRGGIFRRAFI